MKSTSSGSIGQPDVAGKKAATYSSSKKKKRSELNKGKAGADEVVAVGCNWTFCASLLILLVICIIFGCVWDIKVASPGWSANPTRFMQYYGLNIGLGIGGGCAYGLMYIIHIMRTGSTNWMNWTRAAATGTFMVSAVLIGFGAAMMVATNYSESETITFKSLTDELTDAIMQVGGNAALYQYFGHLLPNFDKNHLLLSEESIGYDWTMLFWGDYTTPSVYCSDQVVQDKFNSNWGDGCPRVNILNSTNIECIAASSLCSINTLRGLFSHQWYAGATWVILGLFGIGAGIFGFAFVNFNDMANDPELNPKKRSRSNNNIPKSEDTVTESVPLNPARRKSSVAPEGGEGEERVEGQALESPEEV